MSNIITLDKVKQGQNFNISKFSDSNVKCMSTKFGVGEGQVLKCVHKTSGGPLILQRKYQEIALGRALTQSIEVQIV
ncbi:MAG: ferrous iron transport protein A [Vampirovibrionia bacterium]